MSTDENGASSALSMGPSTGSFRLPAPHWSALNGAGGVQEAQQASAMGFSGNHGTRMLLPFSSHKQRMPEELAGQIGADAGASRPTALLVGPSSGKVWRVEVALDGDGAFLGRGWPEFAGAHGIGGAGWFLVLRHHGGGVLTVKAFDATCCLKELGAPAVVGATRSSKATSHKPQFIYLLQPALKEKMLIPFNFVQRYIPRKHLNNHFAVILSPLGKFWRIGVEVNQSDVCFAGGWSEFLSFHGIIEGNALLLRYEGNMSFTVKVFGPDGSQIQSKHNGTRIRQIPTVPDIEKQQESTFASGNKRRSRNEKSSSEGQKRPKRSMTSLDNASSRKKSVYEIGPQSWIMKEINKNTLEKHLIGSGWKRFCQDNRLKEGDVCTFNIIKTTLWHVDIKRDIQNQQELPCSSSMKCERKDRSSTEGHKRTKGSMNYLNKISLHTRCVYEIGPPSWIKKEINTNTLENSLCLAPAFCDAIGFQKPCTITLKSSVNITKSWQVFGSPHKNSSHRLGKCKRKNSRKSCEEQKRPKVSMTLNMVSSSMKSVYEIGPPSWIRKEISIFAIQNHLSLARTFCNGIGFRKPRMITLKTSMDSTRCWKVRGLPYNNSSLQLGMGWKKFCQENKLEVGDICTFNVIKPSLWHAGGLGNKPADCPPLGNANRRRTVCAQPPPQSARQAKRAQPNGPLITLSNSHHLCAVTCFETLGRRLLLMITHKECEPVPFDVHQHQLDGLVLPAKSCVIRLWQN
ncbi:hypothetical protein U9M48_031922 [Paspalum notatum var. saurae]|uniref:TF-B3 domain-containing protein n=1 Tax=Paspalum notatum var. saurae TaxID=547442 RepID=A0AAQ3X4X5_PASNO